jgi:hypothetical protein
MFNLKPYPENLSFKQMLKLQPYILVNFALKISLKV